MRYTLVIYGLGKLSSALASKICPRPQQFSSFNITGFNIFRSPLNTLNLKFLTYNTR